MKTPTLFSLIIAHLTIFSSIPDDSLALVEENNCFEKGIHTFVILNPTVFLYLIVFLTMFGCIWINKNDTCLMSWQVSLSTFYTIEHACKEK